MSNWTFVCHTSDIANNDCRIIEHAGTPIAIFNLAGTFYAIQDRCPHQALPLADGFLEDTTITCPYHGAKFDLTTGQLLSEPMCDDLTTYPVKVEDQKISIAVE